MWPFKKKTPIQEGVREKTATSVICIPGNWNSWDEFTAALVSANNLEYMAVGNILMNAQQKRHYTIEFCERDERMKASFSVAGKVNRVTDDFIDAIDTHTYVVYISGTTGSLEEAEHIARAATAVLKAGGIGVKIETAGKAFDKEKWLALMAPFQPANLYQLFVLDSIINDDGSVYSCGMQNLGLKDTMISGEEFQEAVYLISVFGYYQIVDKPTIHPNQTFSLSREAPVFIITDELRQPNLGHETFENPFGMWRLTKA